MLLPWVVADASYDVSSRAVLVHVACLPGWAACAQLAILESNRHIPVKTMRHIPGWPEPPTKESELEELFQKTLEPDFAYWRKKGPFSARTVWGELQAHQVRWVH